MPYHVWQRWYDTRRWRRIRRVHLAHHPLCVFCIGRGIAKAATVVDHVEPHHGDRTKFWLGPFQSLCADCHDSTKRLLEQRGYDPAIGEDGWPLDPQHPSNRDGQPRTACAQQRTETNNTTTR